MALLFIGLFAMFSYSTELVTERVNGDFQYVFTSYNNIPVGSEPQTQACSNALRAEAGECSLWVSGLGAGVRLLGGPDDVRLQRLNRVVESDWATSVASSTFQLQQGRWPEAPGEVVVGPDYAGTERIEAWGGRIVLTVVGRANEKGWRRGDFLLIAPGTFASWSGRGMGLSGISAQIRLRYNTAGPSPIRAGMDGLAVAEFPAQGSVRPRDLVAKDVYDLQGMLAMFLPTIALAGAGGVGAALVLHRWQRRVVTSASQQGLAHRQIRKWLRGAQLRGLLLWVPMGALAGYALSWLAQPAIQLLLGHPLARPVTRWELLVVPGVVAATALFAAGNSRRPRRIDRQAQPLTTHPAHGLVMTFLALVGAIWAGPLLSWSATWEEILGGVLLSISLGFAAPWIVRAARWLPTRSLVAQLARRHLANASGIGTKLGPVVAALGMMTMVVTSLASSTMVFNQQIHSSSASPAHTISIRTEVPEVRSRLSQWAGRAGLEAHPLWFAGPDSRGRELLLVEGLDAAAIVIGRHLTPEEARALSQGRVLAPSADESSGVVRMRRSDGGWTELSTHALGTYDPFLYGRAGLMLHEEYRALPGAVLPALDSNQFAIMGGRAGDEDRASAAATDLGIGPLYYSVPSRSDQFTGALWDKAQPWLLGLISGLVMFSMVSSLAGQLRPLRSALFTTGLPRRIGLELLAHQIALVVPAVVILGVLPGMLGLLLSSHNGNPVIMPWGVLARSVGILLVSCSVGAVLGSLKLRHTERFSQ